MTRRGKEWGRQGYIGAGLCGGNILLCAVTKRHTKACVVCCVGTWEGGEKVLGYWW